MLRCSECDGTGLFDEETPEGWDCSLECPDYTPMCESVKQAADAAETGEVDSFTQWLNEEVAEDDMAYLDDTRLGA